MKKLTKQDIFNISANGLLKQGKKSVDAHSCLYRGPNGLKCAIGMLIPDELYQDRFEGQSASDSGAIKTLNVPDTAEYALFLDNLQDIHDEHLPNEWDHELVNFAHYYGLNPLPMYEGVKELP